LAVFVVWLRFKNLFVASVLVSVFTLPIIYPNKYYFIEVIRGEEILEQIYQEGYLVGYGLNIPNIFILLGFVSGIFEIIKRKSRPIKIKSTAVKLVLLSGVGFFLACLAASIKYSPFIDLSLTWTLQYMQLFVIAFLILLFYLTAKSKFNLISLSIISAVILEGALALLQFARQGFAGIPIEAAAGTAFPLGLDEVNAIFRVAGSLMFHNQLALVMLTYLILLLPHFLQRRKALDFLGILICVITIVLTQSRSVWIASLAVGFLAASIFKKEIVAFANLMGTRKVIIYSVIIALGLSYIVLPRVVLSFNAFYEGAGIPIRLKLLKEALDAFVQNPWIGYGVGTNEYVLHSLFPTGVTTVFPTVVHAGILQLILEVGLIGICFILLPFFLILRGIINGRFLKSQILQKRQFPFSFIAGLLAFFLYYLFLPHVGIIEFAYLGIILGYGMVSFEV